MLNCYFSTTTQSVIPILVLPKAEIVEWQASQPAFVQHWLRSMNFPQQSFYCLIPNAQGELSKVVVALDDINEFWTVGGLTTSLPPGHYAIEGLDPKTYPLAVMAWGLGAYQFTKYKSLTPNKAKLSLDKAIALSTDNMVESIYLVRDLINTPTEDMGPENLFSAAHALGTHYHARVTEIVGDELLRHNYPAIHTVGRASDEAPRLIDLQWGDPSHPKVTLVGKGVCFDTGGLDLKSASNMQLMRKDMGGAAHVLGLAKLIMSAELPIRLRVLIPAVENSVAGNAYRPGDIVKTRKGLTVEIGNTDAEGRVILSDALTEADSESPEMIIDFATLTGAARVAVGPDISALFSNHDGLAQSLLTHAKETHDPVWQLPLYKPYEKLIETPYADINNSSSSAYGGSITAALFLNKFISPKTPWAHFDLMAWNLSSRPGRPEGGEAMGLRAVFSYLSERYGRS